MYACRVQNSFLMPYDRMGKVELMVMCATGQGRRGKFQISRWNKILEISLDNLNLEGPNLRQTKLFLTRGRRQIL